MRKIIFITHIIFAIGFNSALGQETTPSKTELKHIVYGAFGSPSLFASVNYEIKIKEISHFCFQPRVGVGFNFFNPSLGQEFNLNTGISCLYGKKKSKGEIDFGFVHDFYPEYNYDKEKDILKYKAIIYAGIGYRFQPQDKGVMFKILVTPTFTINPDNLVFFPYAELGIGYVFGKKEVAKTKS